MLSKPLIIAEYRIRGTSNHPQRRGRPVTEPNSFPRVRIWSPQESKATSLRNGPAPTLVIYALETPTMAWMRVGGTPVPVQRAAGRSAGRRNKRIGAMIDIQHRALSALEHDTLARGDGVVEQARGVANHRANALGQPWLLGAHAFVVVQPFLEAQRLGGRLMFRCQRVEERCTRTLRDRADRPYERHAGRSCLRSKGRFRATWCQWKRGRDGPRTISPSTGGWSRTTCTRDCSRRGCHPLCRTGRFQHFDFR